LIMGGNWVDVLSRVAQPRFPADPQSAAIATGSAAEP
jgi:hypothetical protein